MNKRLEQTLYKGNIPMANNLYEKVITHQGNTK